MCREVEVDLDSYWFVDARKAPQFTSEVDLDELAKHYHRATLESLVRTHLENSTVYRSYTNSVIMNAGKSEILLLLPRYRAGQW
ncbi:hypothetical protein [Pelagicoccus sp. SDUM812002]|uniref:hypothetical protein n=1 Tax=Pelagicoccus sp. SDUM812002 TaxID=3041266 RepID=UPI00280D16F8|nr:hypothetical protein [Pelagicoccus sp. SDUM812002]MDQ8185774.1 hypothetical protein [Pelagicoccus sp. SDUM812002]